VPYGASIGGGEPGASARPARELTPTPRTTPVPVGNEAAARDAQRRTDLATVAAGLRAYGERHGQYPVASDVQNLCEQGTDAGCALKEVLEFIPRDPLREHGYLYTSSGDTFTLFAQMDGAGNTSQCPQPLGDRVRIFGDSLYCVSSP